MGNLKTAWDFVEIYYPKYYSAFEITYNDILYKILEGQMEPFDEAYHIFEDLKEEYSCKNDKEGFDAVQKEIYKNELEIYKLSILRYVESLNNL